AKPVQIHCVSIPPFLRRRDKSAWKLTRSGQYGVLWDTAKAEITSENARHAARKPSELQAPKRPKRRRRNSPAACSQSASHGQKGSGKRTARARSRAGG